MAIWNGNNLILRGRKLTMVMNHLLNGMILQVPCGRKIEGGWQSTISTIIITLLGTAPYPLPVGTFESMIFRISQGGICYRFLEVTLQNKALVGNSVGVFHICPCDWLDVWWNSIYGYFSTSPNHLLILLISMANDHPGCSFALATHKRYRKMFSLIFLPNSSWWFQPSWKI